MGNAIQWSLLILTAIHMERGQHMNAHKIQYPPFPSFAEKSPKTVSASAGDEVHLSCKIQDRQEFALSWLRDGDLHILTVEDFSFTSDQRFQAVYHPFIREYHLRIQHVRPQDAGWYECQISSKPILRLRVLLEVQDPMDIQEPYKSKKSKLSPEQIVNKELASVWTEILYDKSDMYVPQGSLINITCRTSIADPSKTVFWYHKDNVISYYSMRGGVSLITDIGNHTMSSLLIKDAYSEDEGTYTCSPSHGVEAKIRVFVIESVSGLDSSTSVDLYLNGLIKILICAVAIYYGLLEIF